MLASRTGWAASRRSCFYLVVAGIILNREHGHPDPG